MKESVDKCTKKTEIQSQKWQYDIAHMYNFVRKNSSHHPKKRIIRFHSSGIFNPFLWSPTSRVDGENNDIDDDDNDDDDGATGNSATGDNDDDCDSEDNRLSMDS